MAQKVNNLPIMQEIQVRSLGQEDHLKKGMATHSSSCLENPRDGGAWSAAVSGVAQSRTRLKRRSSSSSRHTDLFFTFLLLLLSRFSRV